MDARPRLPDRSPIVFDSHDLPVSPGRVGYNFVIAEDGEATPATDCASLAYSFLDRPESVSSEETTTSLFQ